LDREAEIGLRSDPPTPDATICNERRRKREQPHSPKKNVNALKLFSQHRIGKNRR
jgi:hypothetical protein